MREIHTDDAPKAVGPYSQAVQTGTMIFCSGQIGLTPAGLLAGDTVEEQTKQVLQNLDAVLKAAGATFANVVKTTVYITDVASFAQVNEIYAEYFKEGTKPARATVGVKELPKGAKVEIDAIAIV